jgi:hypothetical protein
VWLGEHGPDVRRFNAIERDSVAEKAQCDRGIHGVCDRERTEQPVADGAEFTAAAPPDRLDPIDLACCCGRSPMSRKRSRQFMGSPLRRPAKPECISALNERATVRAPVASGQPRPWKSRVTLPVRGLGEQGDPGCREVQPEMLHEQPQQPGRVVPVADDEGQAGHAVADCCGDARPPCVAIALR